MYSIARNAIEGPNPPVTGDDPDRLWRRVLNLDRRPLHTDTVEVDGLEVCIMGKGGWSRATMTAPDEAGVKAAASAAQALVDEVRRGWEADERVFDRRRADRAHFAAKVMAEPWPNPPRSSFWP